MKEDDKTREDATPSPVAEIVITFRPPMARQDRPRQTISMSFSARDYVIIADPTLKEPPKKDSNSSSAFSHFPHFNTILVVVAGPLVHDVWAFLIPKRVFVISSMMLHHAAAEPNIQKRADGGIWGTKSSSSLLPASA
jgi:hypothetical protein